MSDLPARATAATALDLLAAKSGFPVGTLLDQTAGWVIGFYGRVGDQRAADAFNAYVDQWATLRGLQPPDAAEEVARMLTEGTTEHDEKLYDMFRSMGFARSRAAWPYIARMTAEYVNDGRPRDEFFRRAGWLLERCEDGDVRLLKVALDATTEGWPPNPRPSTWARWTSKSGHLDVMIGREGGGSPTTISGAELTAMGDGPSRDLVRLVAESRLARQLAESTTGGTPGIEFRFEDGHIGGLMSLFRQ